MHKQLFLILRKLILSILLFTFFSEIHAQDIGVAIKVVNQKKEALPFASVTIVNRLDTTQISKTVADSSGIAKFSLTKTGQYIVKITSVNYQSIEKGITVTNNQTSFNFTAEPLGKTLETAVVTSKKPLMRQEDDKLIIDPENLVAASTSGYEALSCLPSVRSPPTGRARIPASSCGWSFRFPRRHRRTS